MLPYVPLFSVPFFIKVAFPVLAVQIVPFTGIPVTAFLMAAMSVFVAASVTLLVGLATTNTYPSIMAALASFSVTIATPTTFFFATVPPTRIVTCDITIIAVATPVFLLAI